MSYMDYRQEPEGWDKNKTGLTWDAFKARVEDTNLKWWEKHTADGSYANRTETEIDISGEDFPLGRGNRYGPFIYAPLPVTGKTRWGFQRAEGMKLFLADVAAGALPKKDDRPAPPPRPAPAPPTAREELSLEDDGLSLEDPSAGLELEVEDDGLSLDAEPEAELSLELEAEPTIPAQMEGDDDGLSLEVEPELTLDDEDDVDEWGMPIKKG